MPDEEIQEVTENEEQEAIDVNKDNTKSVVLLMVALSMIVLICTPIITIFVVKSFDPNTKKEDKATINQDLTEIKLSPPFSVNIEGTKGTRYVRVDVVIEVSHADLKKYFEEKSDTNPDGMLNKIRSIIVNIISDKNMNNLLPREAKESLGDEIRQELNRLLKERTKKAETVRDVYFPSFLIQ